MVFSSVFFLFVFLPLTLILYYIVPHKAKNVVALLASLLFYAWGEPVYLFLMLFSIVFNYLAGLVIGAYGQDQAIARKRLWLVITVIVNIAILGFFKYYGFVLTNINALFHLRLAYKELSLPIGISFYTFQALSYVIDVYKQKTESQKNFICFALYISMFPQLIAGPIVRYEDVAPQLKRRTYSLGLFGDGTAWFLRGLFKKVLLANTIGSLFDTLHALPLADMTVASAWLGAIAYTLQIYFDFSGYSDMAIGLGKMLGFRLCKNFDYPYISTSITEFWRRWHISLGSWFREYVYIPLGGNRVSTPRAIFNIFVVWMLTGLWHGAAWNFVLWGVYYGVLLMLEKYLLRKPLSHTPSAVKHLYTLLFVMIGWVFFFSPTLSGAIQYLGAMIGIGTKCLWNTTVLYYLHSYFIPLIVGVVAATPLIEKAVRALTFKTKPKLMITLSAIAYMGLFFVCTAYLVNDTYNPFLYFRF